jgi:quinol monooxygenase YgiN
MDAFESVHEPSVFAIHSEWIDEAAFDLHATLPHTVQFLSAAQKLFGRPIEGLRLRRMLDERGSAKPKFSEDSNRGGNSAF